MAGSKQKRSSLKEKIFSFLQICLRNKFQIIFCLLLAFHIFLRFYELPERAHLGWDQVDSAWPAKQMIVDHMWVVEGVPIKSNAALTMGPLYYYMITPFYYFTNLDPIASPIFAGVMSIFSFLILFYVTKKLFNTEVALIAAFIGTFSLTIINGERIQNGIALIVPVSYLIFYFLYKAVTGESKYIPWLAAALGFSFHIDFTSVLYPIIILFTLPFFPRTKETLRYLLIALPILLLFFLPMILVQFSKQSGAEHGFINLFNTTFHGFHVRRVLQLTHDAFIQFVVIFQYKFIDYFAFLIPPVFAVIYYLQNRQRERIIFAYLLLLWIVVPWFVLSTYRGELTDSYFSLPRDLFIAMLAYFTWLGFKQRFATLKVGLIVFWGYFMFSNLQLFFKPSFGNFLSIKSDVRQAIQNKKVIRFIDHDPHSYIYYVESRKSH